jgi:hypothetical protein
MLSSNKNPRIFIRGKAHGLCPKKVEKHAGDVNPFTGLTEERGF